MDSPQLHLFLHNGLVYSLRSPNFPPFTVYGPERDFIPENTSRLCWALDEFPHIAFLPVNPIFEGQIFGRLANPRIENEHAGSAKWALVEASRQSWYSLETGLRWMASVLLENHLTSLEFAPFPFPSSFGYLRSHKSKVIATRCAMQSQGAFANLAALCSFAIAQNLRSPAEIDPEWVRKLHDKGFHPAWVENFRATQFGDLVNTERVGAVIHPQCRWLFQVPIMLRANVPLWFYWEEGNNPNLYEQKLGGFHVRPFRPTSEQMLAVRAVEVVPIATSDQGQSYSVSPTARSNPRNKDDQRPGETWQEYFRRRDESFRIAVAKESDEGRKTRLQREQHAATGAPPGKAGARLYEWDECDGELRRVLVPRTQASATWSMYTKAQRRFNSVKNEWDLCRQFVDDQTTSKESEPYSFDSDDSDELPHPTPISLQPPPQLDSYWKEDLASWYQDYSTPGLDVPIWDPPLGDMLYYRYGFSPPTAYAANPVVIKGTIADVKTVFGHRNAPILSTGETPAILEFYNALLMNLQIPRKLCDLSAEHEYPLASSIAASDAIVKVKVADDRFYVLEPRNPPVVDALWQVVVKDPVTAAQCYREDWACSRIDIAKFLLSRGIPFSTRAVLPALNPATVTYNFIGLGRRPEHHKPDRFDYIEYEQRLAEFLPRPHARAALLKGGLVWRLVREIIGGRDNQKVLAGPSEYVRQFGDHLHLDSAEPDLWDDVLSKVELDFICGLYKVYTGKCSRFKLLYYPHESLRQVLVIRQRICHGGQSMRHGRKAL